MATAVHIEREVLLLRKVAIARATRDGGRISVSAVLNHLVRDHWRELEGELWAGAGENRRARIA